MELSSDGVPLDEIYNGGFNIACPPNSPWAALDGDFGLELTGYMSHIAELPGEGFPFRYYTHDPWWLNSPWFDRYGREPHDIYLPMAVGRMNGEGGLSVATSISILTADDSFGNMPEQCPNEVIPHILQAGERSPDQPGPLVWVYPFDEYHEMTFGGGERIDEVFFGDWFVRQAVNNGLPLNTVVSTANFLSSRHAKADLYEQSVLVTPVPEAGSEVETALMETVRAGGRLLLYGPLRHASEDLLRLLNLTLVPPLDGEMDLNCVTCPDTLSVRPYPIRINHRPLMSAGGISAVLREPDNRETQALVSVSCGDEIRVAALAREKPEWNGGRVGWVRGTNSCRHMPGEFLLAPDDPDKWFIGGALMRHTLCAMGYEFAVNKKSPAQRDPVVCVARSNNGFYFSGYSPNTTVELGLRFPQGAPLLLGFETQLIEGCSTYTMPRAWRRECRVFVEQEKNSELSCVEVHSGEIGVCRRMLVKGLEDATIRFYPEGSGEVRMLVNAGYPYETGEIEYGIGNNTTFGHCLVAREISGSLLISW